MKRKPTNIGASVRARLLNRARSEGRPFQEVLHYYAMERFLFRLSRSAHASRFVLKGALMLQFWGGPLSRSTKDIDLLGKTTNTVDELVAIMRSCVRDTCSMSPLAMAAGTLPRPGTMRLATSLALSFSSARLATSVMASTSSVPLAWLSAAL